MTKSKQPQYRPLTATELETLERHGCSSADWSGVKVSEDFDATRCALVRFVGQIRLGAVTRLYNSTLADCSLADATVVDNVGHFTGWRGKPVAVNTLDETGSRSISVGPELLCAGETAVPHYDIHPHARIEDCRRIDNVVVGAGATVSAATSLADGIVGAGAEIGAGVIAKRFYLAEYSCLTDGFTLHDSIVLPCSRCGCGEAAASIIGPYSTTMHKSTLLIGGVFPFFNAGSGTNQSNHRYKLGPIHYGSMDRGCRTASDAYIMWPATIGAFTTVIGKITSSPDTLDFPFSYLIGNPDGTTTILPGATLRGIGRIRDDRKWRQRTRQPGRFVTDSLNPYTFFRLTRGIHLLEAGNECNPTGATIKTGWRERGAKLYRLAADLYAGQALLDRLEARKPVDTPTAAPAEWTDTAGNPEPTGADPTASTEELAWAQIRDYLRDKCGEEFTPMALAGILRDYVKAEQTMNRMLHADIQSELRVAGLASHPLSATIDALCADNCRRAETMIQTLSANR